MFPPPNPWHNWTLPIVTRHGPLLADRSYGQIPGSLNNTWKVYSRQWARTLADTRMIGTGSVHGTSPCTPPHRLPLRFQFPTVSPPWRMRLPPRNSWRNSTLPCPWRNTWTPPFPKNVLPDLHLRSTKHHTRKLALNNPHLGCPLLSHSVFPTLVPRGMGRAHLKWSGRRLWLPAIHRLQPPFLLPVALRARWPAHLWSTDWTSPLLLPVHQPRRPSAPHLQANCRYPFPVSRLPVTTHLYPVRSASAAHCGSRCSRPGTRRSGRSPRSCLMRTLSSSPTPTVAYSLDTRRSTGALPDTVVVTSTMSTDYSRDFRFRRR